MTPKLMSTSEVNKVFSAFIENPESRVLYSKMALGDRLFVEELALSPGYRLVRVDQRLSAAIQQAHFEIALISDVSEEVVYYNRVVVQPDRFIEARPIIQMLVWRTQRREHRKELHDLAAKIFIHYLLKYYDVIVSAVNQKHEGMSFWQARMYDALAFKFNVYACDMLLGDLFGVKAADDVSRYERWLWGDDNHHQNRLAIISKTILPLNSPNNQIKAEIHAAR